MGTEITELTVSLAAELRAEKAATGLTLDQLVESTGLSKSSIQRYLRGTRVIDIEDLSLFASAYEVQVTELLSRTYARMSK